MSVPDSHAHLSLEATDSPTLLCATHEDQWPVFINYKHKALGVHPWWCDQVRVGWETRLAAALEGEPTALVGECGLDALRGIPEKTQLEVLRHQLRLAGRFRRNVVLHCVRSWEPLKLELQRLPVPGFMVHRFSGDAKQATDIVAMRGMVSVHASEFRKPAVRDAILRIPLKNLLVESDLDKPPATPNEVPEILFRLVSDLAILRQIETDEMKRVLTENFYRFIG